MEELKKTRRKHTKNKRRVVTHTIGDWSWNHDNLVSKIIDEKNPLGCSGWRGSTGPETHLFGGFKRGLSQMTQARRLYWQGEYNEDISDKRITMTCHNTHCMNILHMKLAVNLKLFKGDGVRAAEPRLSTTASSKPVKKKPEKPKIVDINEELERW